VTAPNAPSVRAPERPVDDDHAVRCGLVAGLLLRAAASEFTPADTVELIDDDDGHHLDTVRIHTPNGRYLVAVMRET
jgi:hypothetical protein